MLMPQQRCFGRSSGAAREELDGNRAWIFVPGLDARAVCQCRAKERFSAHVGLNIKLTVTGPCDEERRLDSFNQR